MSENEVQLRRAFCTALDVAADVDFETLAYREIRQWDSVAHMQLVSAIETTFDLMLETEDVIAMSSYLKAKEIVARYGVVL